MRLILDTNVWTYIGEREETEEFEQLEDARGLTVVIPPSILLEASRIPIPEIRARVIDAITRRRGTRVHPLPEARQEADEVVAEIRRHRPSWIRRSPLTSRLQPLENFWTKRIWQIAAKDDGAIAEREQHTPAKTHERIVLQTQLSNKKAAMDAGFKLENSGPWIDLTGQTGHDVLGWNGERFENWRHGAALVWWRGLIVAPRREGLVGGDTTLADWLGPWVLSDVIARDRAGWNGFWYYEVEPARVPRNWIRETMPWVQLESKVGEGNPRDMQHASYLFDADVFVTADRRYVGALERLRQWAPVDFARATLIPGRGSAVQAIDAALEDT